MSLIDNLFAEKGILGLVLQASWISHLVLLILLFMSSLSWAIIFLKWIQFRRISGENEEFLQVYNHERKLEHIHNIAHQFEFSSLAHIFEANYKEITSFRKAIQEQKTKYRSSKELLDRLNERLTRTSSRCMNQEHELLEIRLNPLASISSAAPFIGLFGTVLGIIDSFQQIGESGLTSLSVVAPGISEALIATAAGLLAAIPALMGYNFFRNSIRHESNIMRNFTLELKNRMEWVVS